MRMLSHSIGEIVPSTPAKDNYIRCAKGLYRASCLIDLLATVGTQILRPQIERDPPAELKHINKRRKRNQQGFP